MEDYWSFGNKQADKKEDLGVKEVDINDPESVNKMCEDLIKDIEEHSGSPLSESEKDDIRSQITGILDMLADME